MTQQESEYTRYRMNVQKGDGPDARGDVTVEVVREKRDQRHHQRVPHPGAGEDRAEDAEMKVPTNDAEFAEFKFEVDRAVGALEEKLGLDDE